MIVNIKRMNDSVHLQATNEENVVMQMDGSPAIGGQNLGFRPMQLLLASLGGCSSMDVLSILKKMQQEVSSYEVLVDGKREEGVEPSLFKTIIVTFKLKGLHLDPIKVKKAVDLSMTKYCSVVKTLEPTCKIDYLIEMS